MPIGRIEQLTDVNKAYVAGDNRDIAILLVHDLLGWSFPNIRLLADHYAREADTTVYVPDFFRGEVLPFEPVNAGKWGEVDLAGFMSRNSREIREPEIFKCAEALRVIRKHKKMGAVGFCYGGWAVFHLGSKEHQPPLVDFITAGGPESPDEARH